MADRPHYPERELLLRHACAELESRLRSGLRARADEYFERYPDLGADSELALDLLYTEYLVRAELGEGMLAEDLFVRYPQWREVLREQFEVHRWLRDGAGAERGPAGPPVPANTAQFEILGEIARGGMGVVYKAREVASGRNVALKMILSGAHAGTAERSRFRKEAEAVARISHPNVVKIYWVGEHDGWPCLALEYVGGGTLAQKVAGLPLQAWEAAWVLEALARAIHHIHQQGILHRDVSPRNILLTEDGVPKLTDFGLAKLFAGRAETLSGAQTASVLGTPRYAAPEQLRGKGQGIGPEADVYGLGAVLYEALVGRPPFGGESVLDTLHEVEYYDPPSPSKLRPGIPRDLETICLKCLRKSPEKRYRTAEALAEDLQRFLADEPIRARPMGTWEHGVRLARRHPAVAGLIGAVVLTAVVAFGLIAALWLRAEAARG